jgi:hypothetical protein
MESVSIYLKETNKIFIINVTECIRFLSAKNFHETLHADSSYTCCMFSYGFVTFESEEDAERILRKEVKCHLLSLKLLNIQWFTLEW